MFIKETLDSRGYKVPKNLTPEKIWRNGSFSLEKTLLEKGLVATVFLQKVFYWLSWNNQEFRVAKILLVCLKKLRLALLTTGIWPELNKAAGYHQHIFGLPILVKVPFKSVFFKIIFFLILSTFSKLTSQLR